jgi:hypothetical protein
MAAGLVRHLTGNLINIESVDMGVGPSLNEFCRQHAAGSGVDIRAEARSDPSKNANEDSALPTDVHDPQIDA